MQKSSPKIIILAGYGLNCEEETAAAFRIAAGLADVVHVNDLIAKPKLLAQYQILAIPGGFSYGDDLGGGKAYANKLNNHLKDHLNNFAAQDKLIIGICNGFQILTQAGLLPGSLSFNDNNRYMDRWVDVKTGMGTISGTWEPSPWLKNISDISLPIAHGEGKYGISPKELKTLQKQNQIAGVYYKGEVCKYQSLDANPNGAMLDIAMITSANGKILGTMPHPERAMFFTQSPRWPLKKDQLIRSGKKLPEFGEGLQIFRNAVNYFN